MKCILFVPSEHQRHWIGKYSNFKIPIPPLEIQNKIVAILDTFTELEKELALRTKQYKYYRDFLLSYDELERRAKSSANKDNICNLVQWVSLGEIGSFTRGSGLTKQDFTESGIPCIHYGQIHTYYRTSTHKTILFVSKKKQVN